MRSGLAASRTIKAALILVDIIIALVAYIGAFYLRSLSGFFIFTEPMPFNRYFQVTHYLWLIFASQLVMLYFFGLYDRFWGFMRHQVVQQVLLAVTLQTLFLVSFYFLRAEYIYPRSIFAMFWLLNATLLSVWRLILCSLDKARRGKRKVLIVGADKQVEELLNEIKRLPSYGLEVVGIIDDKMQVGDSFIGYKVLGKRDQTIAIADKYGVDEVIICSDNTWQDKLIEQMGSLQRLNMRISVMPTVYEILIGKVRHLRIYDIPLIEVVKDPSLNYSYLAKRTFDLVVSTMLGTIVLPLIIVIAILVKLTSKGPILYKQTRIGKNGKSFKILKFRTMIPSAEKETGPVLASPDDMRSTKIGAFLRKYRIDELPQLYNIIKGDMSFVGPRPERPYFVEQYKKTIPGYNERFKVKPGLTGLAQVNGGYATSPQNKLKYELAYIYNQSLWLDIIILFETIKVILTSRTDEQ